MTANHTRLEIIGAAVAGVIAATSVYLYIKQITARQELVPVAAVARDLSSPRRLVAADIELLPLPRAALPDGVFYSADELIGRTLTRERSAREILVKRDLVQARDPGSEAALVPPGKIGFTLSAGWLGAALPKIKPNDYLSFYVVLPPAFRGASPATGALLQQVLVLAVEADGAGSPAAALLALEREELGRLLQARSGQYLLVAVAESAQGEREAASSTVR